MLNIEDMPLKDARKLLGLTQVQLAKELGVPARTLQNWENEIRSCPLYVENMIKGRIKEIRFIAKIIHEENFNEYGFVDSQGYSCYLKNEGGEFGFAWFYSVVNDKVPQELIFAIMGLYKSGWKIVFL